MVEYSTPMAVRGAPAISEEAISLLENLICRVAGSKLTVFCEVSWPSTPSAWVLPVSSSPPPITEVSGRVAPRLITTRPEMLIRAMKLP